MQKKKGRLRTGYTPDYVVFDLETTGISPKTDEVIEISAVKVKQGTIVEEFTTLVNPGRRIPSGASRVNGITDEMVREAPPFSAVLPEFARFIGDFMLVGHNIAQFDMKFLYRDFSRFLNQVPANDYLDTLLLARKKLPRLSHHRLTDLAEYYGIDIRGAHRALNDCRMNQQVYERLNQESPEKTVSKESQSFPRAVGEKEKPGVPDNRFPSSFRIRAVVERITYQNPENGYSVLKCAVKDYHDLVTVVGNLFDVNVGSVLLIDGNWKMDSRYGRQFQAVTWQETLPATVFGIEKYLGSGLIKGLGPKFASRIVQKFGVDTLEVIDRDPNRLKEVEGIGTRRIAQIRESWDRQKEIRNVMIFLQDCGVSTSFAAKIYRQYGDTSIETIKNNPFCLADDIWGIGFKTADRIAAGLGVQPEAFIRLRSGLLYTISTLADEGHVYAEKEQLIRKAVELLETEEGNLVMTLDQMLADGDLLDERRMEAAKTRPDPSVEPDSGQPQDGAIYLPAFYYAEKGVASGLKRILRAPATDRLWKELKAAQEKTGNPELSVNVESIKQQTGMEYDEIQSQAIRKAALHKIMILTGGPGTGKTTVTRGILEAFRRFHLRILLAAPTGRAAKRMTEAAGAPVGLEAKTIHRLLEFKPPQGYQKNEENPLEGDVLIVDECSMIDLILMNSLLKAIPDSMRLILIGDTDQLPSVGAGNVLRDMIDSGVVPVVRLTKIFRQAQTSRIITNAHRVNSGRMPDLSNGRDTDFFFVEREIPEMAMQEIVRLVSTKLPRYYGILPDQIQVLTPMQKGVIGAASLNLALQEALNPQGEGLRRGGMIFRVHDRVMQIRNNYEKEVFNGDIGRIEAVDLQEKTLSVRFDDRLLSYEISQLDELVHAYAATIHKAQGSEYPVVVMPVLMSHFVMLQRNLVYTGITRAKKILVLVGTKNALSYAVRNVTVTRRNSLLKRRLEEVD